MTAHSPPPPPPRRLPPLLSLLPSLLVDSLRCHLPVGVVLGVVLVLGMVAVGVGAVGVGAVGDVTPLQRDIATHDLQVRKTLVCVRF